MHAVYWMLTHPINRLWPEHLEVGGLSERFFGRGLVKSHADGDDELWGRCGAGGGARTSPAQLSELRRVESAPRSNAPVGPATSSNWNPGWSTTATVRLTAVFARFASFQTASSRRSMVSGREAKGVMKGRRIVWGGAAAVALALGGFARDNKLQNTDARKIEETAQLGPGAGCRQACRHDRLSLSRADGP